MKKIDFLLIIGILILCLGYYWWQEQNHPDQQKQQGQKVFQKPQKNKKPWRKNIPVRPPRAEQKITAPYEQAVQIYSSINEGIKKSANKYKIKQRKYLEELKQAKESLAQYLEVSKRSSTRGEDVKEIAQKNYEVAFKELNAIVQSSEMAMQSISGVGEKLKEAVELYKKLGRTWEESSQGFFTKHIDDHLYHQGKMEEIFQNIQNSFNEYRESIQKLIALSSSSMDLLKELKGYYRLKETDPDKAKKLFKENKNNLITKQKNIEKSMTTLEKTGKLKIDELTKIVPDFIHHLDSSLGVLEKVSQYFPIQRGLSDSIKHLFTAIFKQPSTILTR